MTFTELNINPSILKALQKEGYVTPTPIQEQAIPPVLEGHDLLGCAQTGTGKTAAFALPILEILSRERPQKQRVIRSLILTPTRELAVQINESFLAYARFMPMRTCVIFGGVPQSGQVRRLQQGVDILVATPGRLNDLINQGFIDLSHVEIFVLDEADRMLDMGFIHDVRRILEKIPEKRQTLFFSATMPPEISTLVAEILNNPVKVTITPPATTVDSIAQSVYFVDKNNKRDLLLHLLKQENIPSALVFTRTKHGADRVVKELTKAKITAAAIHGDKSQNARQLALKNFKKHSIRVLVATDIAARGIDIDELSHVVNYDIPEVPETYVHRIGRTGRAGLSGIAVSFCDIDEKSDLRNIQKVIGKTIPVVADHPYPMQVLVPTPKSQLRGGHGRRPQRENVAPASRPFHAQAGQKPRRKPENRSAVQRPAEEQKRAPQSRQPRTARTGQAADTTASKFEKPIYTKPVRHPKIESLTEHAPVGERSSRRPRSSGQTRGQQTSASATYRTEPMRKRPADQPLGQTQFGRKG